MPPFADGAVDIAPDPLFATTIDQADAIGYRVGIH
jgi:hypothetical protein